MRSYLSLSRHLIALILAIGLPCTAMAGAEACVPNPMTDDEKDKMVKSLARLTARNKITFSEARNYIERINRQRLCLPVPSGEAYSAGYRDGREQAQQKHENTLPLPSPESYEIGYRAGYSDGIEEGKSDGLEEGKEEICHEVESINADVAQDAGC